MRSFQRSPAHRGRPLRFRGRPRVRWLRHSHGWACWLTRRLGFRCVPLPLPRGWRPSSPTAGLSPLARLLLHLSGSVLVATLLAPWLFSVWVLFGGGRSWLLSLF